MSRRGLSSVVTIILVILIAMAAVAIIWKYALPLVENISGLDTQTYATRLSVSPDSVSYNPNTDSVSLNVIRDAGDGDIAGFMVGLTDQDGNVKSFRKNFSIGEYETKQLQLTYTDLAIDDVLSVTITPIFRQNGTNKETFGIPIQQPVSNKTPYAFPIGLKAHWKFNDGCTEYVNSLNCSQVGNANYDSVIKKVGPGSASLGGSASDYFQAINDAIFTTNTFTIIAWVNPKNLTSSNFSNVLDRSSESTGFTLGFDNASSTWQLRTKKTGNQNIVSIPGTNNLNTWEFIAASYDSSNSVIYYNSTSNSFNNLFQLELPTNPPRIGADFNGNLDEVMFFNMVLTPQQIDNIRRKYRQ